MEKQLHRETEKELFFSIIIPAHNGEKYIMKTLKILEDLNYFKEKFKVIVVENGSNDRTSEIISEFEQNSVLPLKTFKLCRNGITMQSML